MDSLSEIKTVYRRAMNVQNTNEFKIEQIDWLIVQVERRANRNCSNCLE